MKVARVGVLVVALAAVAAFIGIGLPEGAKGSAEPTDHTITVNGSGTASTVPGQAQFCFDVEDHADTAEAASPRTPLLCEGHRGATSAGVADKDLQTVHVSVAPDLQRRRNQGAGYVRRTPCAQPRASRTPDQLLERPEAGADRVRGPNLTKADSDKLYDDALRAAVADARRELKCWPTPPGSRSASRFDPGRF